MKIFPLGLLLIGLVTRGGTAGEIQYRPGGPLAGLVSPADFPLGRNHHPDMHSREILGSRLEHAIEADQCST